MYKRQSQTQLDEIWDQVLGPIPDAPGLDDIDELYPEDRIKPMPDDIQLPPLQELPPLEALPPLAEIPAPEPEITEPLRPKRRRLKLLIAMVFIATGVAVYFQWDAVNELLDSLL